MGKNHRLVESLFPTTNYSNSGNKDMFYQKWVADLAVANPIGLQLRAVFAHEDLVHQHEALKGNVQECNRKTNEGDSI